MRRKALKKILQKVILNPKAGRGMGRPLEMTNRMVLVDGPVARQYLDLDLNRLVKETKIRNMLTAHGFKQFQRLQEREGMKISGEEALEVMAAVSAKRNRD